MCRDEASEENSIDRCFGTDLRGRPNKRRKNCVKEEVARKGIK